MPDIFDDMAESVDEIVVDLPIRFTSNDRRLIFELDSDKPGSIVTKLNDITLIFDLDTFKESPEGYLSREAELLSRYHAKLKPYVMECISDYDKMARSSSDMDYSMLFATERNSKIAITIAKVRFSVKQLPKLTTLKWSILDHLNAYSLGFVIYNALEASFERGNQIFREITANYAASLSSEAVSNAKECVRLTTDIRHLYSIMAGNMTKRRDEAVHFLQVMYPDAKELSLIDGACPKPI